MFSFFYTPIHNVFIGHLSGAKSVSGASRVINGGFSDSDQVGETGMFLPLCGLDLFFGGRSIPYGNHSIAHVGTILVMLKMLVFCPSGRVQKPRNDWWSDNRNR